MNKTTEYFADRRFLTPLSHETDSSIMGFIKYEQSFNNDKQLTHQDINGSLSVRDCNSKITLEFTVYDSSAHREKTLEYQRKIKSLKDFIDQFYEAYMLAAEDFEKNSRKLVQN